MNTFLSVGTNHIFPEIFQPIKNSKEFKPTGGIWATEHKQEYYSYNVWIEFLRTHLNVLFYKNKRKDKFNIPAIFITLKENARIFIVKSSQELQFLKDFYPDGRNWIDFEALAKDFDGIFIDLPNVIRSLKDTQTIELISKFAVSSLIIFNLDCIDYYQKAKVSIEPFDYEFLNEFDNYQVDIDREKIKIGKPNIESQVLIEKIKEYIKSTQITGLKLYNQIANVFASEINETITAIENSNQATEENLRLLLIKKSIDSI